jgi:folylpolyglutamate synthase/dihydropteroate synthase
LAFISIIINSPRRAFLEEILLEAGYKVGVYSSPHILRFTERLRINKQELSASAHCDAFSVVELYRQKTSLSFFEYVTLSCLHLLKQAQCDFILLEVGLGGRLDATNMVVKIRYFFRSTANLCYQIGRESLCLQTLFWR